MILLIFGLLSCTPETDEYVIDSPDGELTVAFELENQHRPVYRVIHDGSEVILNSPLGVVMDDIDFTRNMEMLAADEAEHVTPPETEVIDETYTLVHGKQEEATYWAHEKIFHLRHESGRYMDVVFRVSNDGVALKYRFPDESDERKSITREHTGYIFPEDARAWITPIADVGTGFEGTNPSYEEQYFKGVEIGHPAPPGRQNGWAYPALFRTGQSWVLITEAGLGRDYPGTRLRELEDEYGYHVGFPDPEEVITGEIRGPESELPWSTPWRIMAVGDLATITESSLGTDLAEPNRLEDTSFVEPGLASWSWVKLGDESMRYSVQKDFVDYAADMDWDYTLVDAYWDEHLGYDGVAELADYAAEQGVELLLWYNSAGDWNTAPQTPKDELLTREDRREEFARISEMGVRGVKIDFFAGDGQSVINYYLDILEDAADFDLMVNTHGSTIPRGWHRTYPNLVTMESVKGFEYITFDQETADSAASHSTMQPFTRNVFGPMDFTPVSLHEIPPDIEQRTTNAFELATAIVFYSAVQHIAEVPDGMERAPEFAVDFLKQVPATWDETRFIKGHPGQLAVLARRSGNTWYVGGINGDETEKTLEVDLSGLEGAESGFKITDGEHLRAMNYDEVTVNPGEPFTMEVSENGGFVFVLSDS